MEALSAIKKSGKYFYTPSVYRWVFGILFLLLSVIYSYHEILFFHPQSVHQWRQCDCLSTTYCFYQDGNSFMQPAVQYQGNGQGRTAGEFPLFYFLVAQLWKLFGHHEFIYRLSVIVLAFSAFFFLFRLMEEELRDSFWSLFIVGMLFTSPLLVYYTNNFLLNVPAFSLSLFALYFFWKHYRTRRNLYFTLFALFYLIAGLLKTTALFGFAALFALILLEQINILRKGDEPGLISKPVQQLIVFSLVPLLVFGWYFYLHQYNQKNGASIYLSSARPIWDLDGGDIKQVWAGIRDNLRWNYLRPVTQVIILLQFVILFIFRKKINRRLIVLLAILAFGTGGFFVLFFQNLDMHDYYVVDLLVLLPFIACIFLWFIKVHYPTVFHSKLLRVAAFALLVHNTDFARRRINYRYRAESDLNRNRTEYTHAFETITPYLRSVGVRAEDKVICFPDESPNITLYLMQQKGWTMFNTAVDSVDVRKRIDQGAQYLILYTPKVKENEQLKPFLTRKAGSYKIVDIYKL